VQLAPYDSIIPQDRWAFDSASQIAGRVFAQTYDDFRKGVNGRLAIDYGLWGARLDVPPALPSWSGLFLSEYVSVSLDRAILGYHHDAREIVSLLGGTLSMNPTVELSDFFVERPAPKSINLSKHLGKTTG